MAGVNVDANDILADEHAVEQAKEYLRQGDTVEFYEFIASQLLREMPANPVDCCLHYVTIFNESLKKGDYEFKGEMKDYDGDKKNEGETTPDTYALF